MKLYLPKHVNPLKSAEAKGRHVGKPVGSYVIDLADLKKSIFLCSNCVSGFEPKAHHYEQHRSIQWSRGKCDACRKFDLHCMYLVHEANNY